MVADTIFVHGMDEDSSCGFGDWFFGLHAEVSAVGLIGIIGFSA